MRRQCPGFSLRLQRRWQTTRRVLIRRRSNRHHRWRPLKKRRPDEGRAQDRLMSRVVNSNGRSPSSRPARRGQDDPLVSLPGTSVTMSVESASTASTEIVFGLSQTSSKESAACTRQYESHRRRSFTDRDPARSGVTLHRERHRVCSVRHHHRGTSTYDAAFDEHLLVTFSFFFLLAVLLDN